jgi:hypothetical protein
MSALSDMINAQSIGAITQMSDFSDGRRSRFVREPTPLFRLPA